MINEIVSLKLRFSIKEIRESDIPNEVSNLNFRNKGTSGSIPAKVLKDSSHIYNSVH